MQVHREIPKLSSTIVTSGSFDGVHLGHQTILHRLTELKRQHTGCQTVVITFYPHPRQVLKPDQKTLLLSSFAEKVALLDEQGIDHLVVIPFTKEFSRTTSQEFIQEILIDKLDTQHLVIGYDHRFGHNREGGFDYLQANQDQYPFRIEEIPRQEIDESGISSTKIREALANGQPEVSNRYLGHNYAITGKVIRGQQIGRTMGYPTANLEVFEENKLIPTDGIYAVWVIHEGKRYGGMLSIGIRPTIGEKLSRTIEVNIFDFKKDIYGDSLTLEFVAYLRPEEKYDGLKELTEQLGRDKVRALEALKM